MFKSDDRSFFLMFFFKDSIFKEPLNLLSSFDHIWGPCYLRETNYNDQINLILGPHAVLAIVPSLYRH